MSWTKTQTNEERGERALDSCAAGLDYGQHFKFTPPGLSFVALYPHWVSPCK